MSDARYIKYRQWPACVAMFSKKLDALNYCLQVAKILNQSQERLEYIQNEYNKIKCEYEFYSKLYETIPDIDPIIGGLIILNDQD